MHWYKLVANSIDSWDEILSPEAALVFLLISKKQWIFVVPCGIQSYWATRQSNIVPENGTWLVYVSLRWQVEGMHSFKKSFQQENVRNRSVLTLMLTCSQLLFSGYDCVFALCGEFFRLCGKKPFSMTKITSQYTLVSFLNFCCCELNTKSLKCKCCFHKTSWVSVTYVEEWHQVGEFLPWFYRLYPMSLLYTCRDQHAIDPSGSHGYQ